MARGLIALAPRAAGQPDLAHVFYSDSGSTAVEVALKMALGYWHNLALDGLADARSRILVLEHSYHGDTIGAMSIGERGVYNAAWTPLLFDVGTIPFPHPGREQETLAALEATCAARPAAFIVEPLILGAGGMLIYPPHVLRAMADICARHDVLFIADEVQTGIARTGSLLATCGNCTCAGHCERQSTFAKADILILGKALSGGAYPVSAVLADDAIMGVIHPGQHGSTFGGNPVAAEVGIAALQVVVDEQLAQNARELGAHFREAMRELTTESDLLNHVRGKGLLDAVIINDTPDSSTAWDLCVALKENGLLAKPTHGNIIRFAPPLVMTREQLDACIGIIRKTVLEFKKG